MTDCEPVGIHQKHIYSLGNDEFPEPSELKIFSLQNTSGAHVDILNYGARMRGLWLPVKGELINIILGYQNLDEYLSDKYYMGGITGRYSNRIRDSRVRIDGSDYQLASNEGNNHLHGGLRGFHARLWDFLPQTSPDRISLQYLSKDGEEGYPGNLKVTADYIWTDDYELTLEMTATTDKETVVNLSNHAYFNLDKTHKSALGHTLMINAADYTPTDEFQIPTGELRSLRGTALDFSQTSIVGENLLRGKADNSLTNGFDHNYIINDNYSPKPIHAATLRSNGSDISMRLSTNTPGLQFYTGNHLSDPFSPNAGLCLETQNFPDAPNHKNFPNSVLKPGEKYSSITRYSFSLPNT